MNYLLARSVMKRVINVGGNSGSYQLFSAAVRGATNAPLGVAEELKGQGFRTVLVEWRRMMSTALERSPMSDVLEKISDGRVIERVEKGDVIVSSYWGVSRPNITREDGTESP